MVASGVGFGQNIADDQKKKKKKKKRSLLTNQWVFGLKEKKNQMVPPPL